VAANTLKFFLLMTGFVDIKIAPAIKPAPKNEGQNVDTKSRLNGRDHTVTYKEHCTLNYILPTLFIKLMMLIV